MSGYTADILSEKVLVDENMNILQKPFTSEELPTGIRKTPGRVIPLR